ncbi:MAG: S-layer homology domain-containing protein, partial [Candidatus Ancillula sp.]|nr:S-layer homology domain-containing protein [Candidatus Ancillula sp.]
EFSELINNIESQVDEQYHFGISFGNTVLNLVPDQDVIKSGSNIMFSNGCLAIPIFEYYTDLFCSKPSMQEAGSKNPEVSTIIPLIGGGSYKFNIGTFHYLDGSNDITIPDNPLKCPDYQHKVRNTCVDNQPTKLTVPNLQLDLGKNKEKKIIPQFFSNYKIFQNKYKKVSYSNSNPKVVRIDSSGKVKALRVGTSLIVTKSITGLTAKSKVTVRLPQVKNYRNNFVDIKNQNKEFQNYIKWMYNYGVTTGVDSKHYAPSNPVRRDQMAAFIHRLVGNPEFKLNLKKQEIVNKMKDLPGGVFRDSIKFLVNDEITTGTTSRTYSPANSVTRLQMALFMYRLADANGVDVKKGETTKNIYKVKDWKQLGTSKENKLAINWLIKNGVSTQKNTNYLPAGLVTRAQMAAFMNRLYNNVLVE